MPISYEKDPYAILGLPVTAPDAEVKKTYRRLARQYHPDLNRDARAAERMKDINWAYSILGDSRKRSSYDFWRRAVSQAASNPRPSPSNPPRSQPWTSRPSSTPRTQSGLGFSAILIFWAIYSLISTMLRSVPDPFDEPSFSINSATRTAQSEKVLKLIRTVSGTQHVVTLPVASPSLTATAESKNIRDKVLPGTQAWEWINQYLADYHLTTPSGLSDEVTAVYEDQSQRGYIVKTRQNGTFVISFYGGQVSVGHIPPIASPTVAP